MAEVSLTTEKLQELRQAFAADELSLVSEGYRKNAYGGFDEWSTRQQADLEALLKAAEAGISVASLTRALEEAKEALAPFRSGWMTSDTEHTARTVIAHMHPERQYELHLSSEDFLRASALVARLSRAQPGQDKTQPK